MMNRGTSKLPIFEFPDGSKFLPTHQAPIVETPWDGWSDEEIVAWVGTRWQESYEAKRAENARLTLNSQYYDGFHYKSAFLNRTRPIENRVYEMVEAMVANTIAARPRPEIQPMRTMDAKRVERLRKFADYLMDTTEWDFAEELSTRDKKIFGYSISLVTFDYATGMPYLKPYSVFDYYPDPSGTRDDERSYWILAGPKNTNRLRATYPGVADKIVPDNWASPSYAAIERPWFEFLESGNDYDHPAMADGALAIHTEDQSPSGTTTLVQAPADRHDHGSTTFTIQIIVRDDAMCDATYYGSSQDPQGLQTYGMKYVAKGFARRCESGLWLISIDSHGNLLHRPKQLDDVYLGLPWVVDYEEQRTDRAWSRSPIDHAIPIQRALNETNFLLDRSLELGGNPPLKTTDAKLDAQLQTGPVAGGDTLLLQQGKDAEWLKLEGPQANQFARATSRTGAIRDIVGVQGAMEGARPPGIEAAAALRNLDNASMRRMKGKENPAHRARSQKLRKLMHAAGKKLQPEITFNASNGEPQVVTSDDLADLYHVRFAPGTGTVEGELDRRDEALALYDREAIDEQALLEVFEWPGAADVAERMVERKMMTEAMTAAAKASAAPSKSGGSSKGSPVGAAA